MGKRADCGWYVRSCFLHVYGECVACVVVVIRGGLIHIRHNKLDFLIRAPYIYIYIAKWNECRETCGETQSNGLVCKHGVWATDRMTRHMQLYGDEMKWHIKI